MAIAPYLELYGLTWDQLTGEKPVYFRTVAGDHATQRQILTYHQDNVVALIEDYGAVHGNPPYAKGLPFSTTEIGLAFGRDRDWVARSRERRENKSERVSL